MSRSHSPVISAEALANQLSGSLPVYVGSEDISKYPKLSHLLEDLSHCLTPFGVHKMTQAQFTQAMHAMEHARYSYLEEATLHRLALDILSEKSAKSKDMKELLEGLTLSELQDHVKLVPSMSSEDGCESLQEKQDRLATNRQCTTFGITDEHLLARIEILMSDDHTKKFANLLEARLEQEWIKIASFKDPKGFCGYHNSVVTQIPEELGSTMRQVFEERGKLVHFIMQTDCLFQQVHSFLLDYGHILKTLMSKQRLSQYPSEHLTSCILRVSVQIAKLRCVELEILADTYTSKSVPALKLLHSHMEERRKEADEALTRLQHELKSYGGLSEIFQELLREFSQLQEDINFCKKSTKEIF